MNTTPELSPDCRIWPDAQAMPNRDFTLAFPALWPLTGEDQIRLTVVSAKAGVTVTVSVRVVNQAGGVQRHVFTFQPGSTRAVQQQDFPIGDGSLCDVSVETPVGAPLYGQVYAMVQLIVGLGGEKQRVSTLTAGYVTQTTPIFGPTTTAAPPVDGPGALRVLVAAVPGAGADVSETVPVGARWELVSLRGILTAGAAVANRLVSLVLDDGANVFFQDTGGFSQVASTAATYCFAQGSSKLAVPTNTLVPGNAPNDNRLSAGFRIRTSTTGIQAADQWSLVIYEVREWLEL